MKALLWPDSRQESNTSRNATRTCLVWWWIGTCFGGKTIISQTFAPVTARTRPTFGLLKCRALVMESTCRRTGSLYRRTRWLLDMLMALTPLACIPCEWPFLLSSHSTPGSNTLRSVNDSWCLVESQNWTGSDVYQVDCNVNPLDPSCTSNGTGIDPHEPTNSKSVHRWSCEYQIPANYPSLQKGSVYSVFLSIFGTDYAYWNIEYWHSISNTNTTCSILKVIEYWIFLELR